MRSFFMPQGATHQLPLMCAVSVFIFWNMACVSFALSGVVTLQVEEAETGGSQSKWPASNQPIDEAIANAELVWNGVRAWQSSVFSGDANLKVKMEQRDPRRGSIENSITAQLLFDTAASSYRYSPVIDGKPAAKHFLRLPDRTVACFVDGKGATVNDAGEAFANHGREQPFDILAAPFATHSELSNRYTTLNTYIDKFSKPGQIAECLETSSGVYMLTLIESLDSDIRRVLWFHVDDVAVPVKLRFDIYDKSSSSISEGRYVTETEWASVQGVKVPKVISLRSDSGPREQSRAINVEWASVNMPIPSSEFSLNSLGLPDDFVLSDNRLGPAVVSRLNETLQSPPLPLNDAKSSRLAPLLLANVAIIAIVLIAVYFFRRRAF